MTTQILKKLVLVSSIFLLAAGCNSAQPATTTGTQTTTTQLATGGKTYTMADVQSASTPEKCWSAINGQVYDLTAWINKHPGGDKNILKICGKDGSSAFNGQHGGQSKPEGILKGFEIGILK
ncbi:MAG: cytochrome b5-like heme/steroid binding domain-containing protein [Candidatus Doudnabacteria bacterium]|jgi:cytochrome b involved in lipid metabolism